MQPFNNTQDLSKAGADRIVASSITLNGTPLDLTATYRVTVNNFLAGGGDGFAVLTQGTQWRDRRFGRATAASDASGSGRQLRQ